LQVKRTAHKLQEEAAVGLRNLAEKSEEALRTLRGQADRQVPHSHLSARPQGPLAVWCVAMRFIKNQLSSRN